MTNPATYADLADRVRRSAPRLGPVRLVAVDGRAGTGKTTFAAGLSARLDGAPVLHTDDLLEGWAGITNYWERLERWVLGPLRRGRPGRYRRFDWVVGRFAEWHDVPVAAVIVVEGVASAAATAGSRVLAVRLQAPHHVRLARGLERDGERLRPRWEQWMAEEDAFFADPAHRAADVVVAGASLRRGA